MSVATSLKPAASPIERAALVPLYFDTGRIESPKDNGKLNPAVIASLAGSLQEHGQLVPGWVAPSPELAAEQRLCLEGNHRLDACRMLGLPFWAFDLGRHVPEEERIRLTFQHNHSRRVMTPAEMAEKAARFMEITGCTAAEAAKNLNVSPPTLSRAFGERRLLPELRQRADLLGQSVRSLVAAAPAAVMGRAIEYALTPEQDGKKPTRDQVSLFIRQLKKSGRSKTRKARTVTLRLNGRAVSLTLAEKDTAFAVAEDLKSIVARLGKHADVPPDGWPFLFQ